MITTSGCLVKPDTWYQWALLIAPVVMWAGLIIYFACDYLNRKRK